MSSLSFGQRERLRGIVEDQLQSNPIWALMPPYARTLAIQRATKSLSDYVVIESGTQCDDWQMSLPEAEGVV